MFMATKKRFINLRSPKLKVYKCPYVLEIIRVLSVDILLKNKVFFNIKLTNLPYY